MRRQSPSTACKAGAPDRLEPSEHVLDAVALSVERAVVRDRDFAVGLGRDAGDNPAFGQRAAEPVGVISPVAEHGLGLRQSVEHQRRALVVAHLAF